MPALLLGSSLRRQERASPDGDAVSGQVCGAGPGAGGKSGGEAESETSACFAVG